MPPKTERSPSLPANKPPRISTRSRATAQALPTPQQPSPPLPSTPVPAVTARRDSDSQAPMPLPTQDSDPPTQEQANTPRATVSSPSTSSSARQTARRDTRTNRRASQSSTTNTVSPGPSDPQQPLEEHARSPTPVSESGEATEFRMPTRSHSVDSSLAEPSEDPSQPGGRRKSTRLTAPVAEPNENEPPPPDTINTPKRRKGGRGASAKTNGLLPGKAKNPAEYDESDDSEVEVAAPKLSREEKKARREALLQERLAELDTMQRQVEEGTHPGFRQELDDIETKRRRKLQIAQTRLEYTRVSAHEFFRAAKKQAFDDFAFGRLALRRSMLEDVQRKITSLHNELIKLKFPKVTSETALDEEGAEDYVPNIRPFMISSLPQGLPSEDIDADLVLMHEPPAFDHREHRSHRHRRHRDRDRDREYDQYPEQEPEYEYEDESQYSYPPEDEPRPVYGDYERDPVYDGREYEYGLLQELSRPREMYYDSGHYEHDYYAPSASTSVAPYMHRDDSYMSYNEPESIRGSSSEEVSPTPVPTPHQFYSYYPPPDPRFPPALLPPPPEASSSSSSAKRKHKHHQRDQERDKRSRYESSADMFDERGQPVYYVEDDDDAVREEDRAHRHHHKHHVHRTHRHSNTSMDRRPSWTASIKKKKKHKKDKFVMPVMVVSE